MHNFRYGCSSWFPHRLITSVYISCCGCSCWCEGIRCTSSCGKSQQYAKVKFPPLTENPFGNIKVDVTSLVVSCIYCCIYFTTKIKITLRDKLLTWVQGEAKKLFVTSTILMPNFYSIIIVVVHRCVIIHLLIIFTLAI